MTDLSELSVEELTKRVTRSVMASMAFTEKVHPGFTHDDYDDAHAALSELARRAKAWDKL